MAETTIAPLPHIAIQVFSETGQINAVVEEARHDRRMAKVQLRVQAGASLPHWKRIVQHQHRMSLSSNR